MKIFGIPNCDKVKKTLKWCQEHKIDYHFHDFRKDGVDDILIEEFLQHFPLPKLFNKRSTTWRQLSETEKQNFNTKLLQEHPTLIPRPVVIINSTATLGFVPEIWQSHV